MFLSAYHYDGDVTSLLAAYDRLRAEFSSGAFLLHVCVLRPAADDRRRGR